MRYIAFDVETPNHRNDRISALGLAVVEGGRILREWSTLVDPECEFDPFNIQLTGITPEQVVGKPNFYDLWQMLEPVFSGGVLCAHNAPFDLGVLRKCLRTYQIDWELTVPYVCTCAISRRMEPRLSSHRLNELCCCHGIALQHHDAGSDASACARLLCDYLSAGMDPANHLRTYDLWRGRTLPHR